MQSTAFLLSTTKFHMLTQEIVLGNIYDNIRVWLVNRKTRMQSLYPNGLVSVSRYFAKYVVNLRCKNPCLDRNPFTWELLFTISLKIISCQSRGVFVVNLSRNVNALEQKTFVLDDYERWCPYSQVASNKNKEKVSRGQ